MSGVINQKIIDKMWYLEYNRQSACSSPASFKFGGSSDRRAISADQEHVHGVEVPRACQWEDGL